MLKSLSSLVSSIVAPPFCGHCHTYLSWHFFGYFSGREPLCIDCLEQVVPILSTKIGTLKVHAVSGYDYPLTSLFNQSHEASVQLGTLLGERVVSSLEVDCLVPVPRYKTEIPKKGYSASLVMAQQVSRLSGIPVVECIQRVKPPLKRGLYTKVERHQYNQGVFRVTPDISEVEDKRVVLIDEVCSSGSTLVEVAKIVKLGRPRDMEAVVVCRVLK